MSDYIKPDRVEECAAYGFSKVVDAHWTIGEAEICVSSDRNHLTISDPTDDDYVPTVQLSDLDKFITMLQSARKWLEGQS